VSRLPPSTSDFKCFTCRAQEQERIGNGRGIGVFLNFIVLLGSSAQTGPGHLTRTYLYLVLNSVIDEIRYLVSFPFALVDLYFHVVSSIEAGVPSQILFHADILVGGSLVGGSLQYCRLDRAVISPSFLVKIFFHKVLEMCLLLMKEYAETRNTRLLFG
jgi:hypothetical protein